MTQQPWLQKVLPLLRGSGIFLLLALLLEITLIINHTVVEEPILITVFDNSTSIRNYKDSANVKAKLEAIKKEITQRFSDRFQLAFIQQVNYLKRMGSSHSRKIKPI